MNLDDKSNWIPAATVKYYQKKCPCASRTLLKYILHSKYVMMLFLMLQPFCAVLTGGHTGFPFKEGG